MKNFIKKLYAKYVNELYVPDNSIFYVFENLTPKEIGALKEIMSLYMSHRADGTEGKTIAISCFKKTK